MCDAGFSDNVPSVMMNQEHLRGTYAFLSSKLNHFRRVSWLPDHFTGSAFSPHVSEYSILNEVMAFAAFIPGYSGGTAAALPHSALLK